MSPTTPRCRSRLSRLAAGAAVVVTVSALNVGLLPTPGAPRVHASTRRETIPVNSAGLTRVKWGVYSDSGQRGSAHVARFSRKTGAKVGRVLDFLPQGSWRSLTHAKWILLAHADKNYTLELSVPLLPARGGNLRDCAAGKYNRAWSSIGRQAVRYGHPDASMRLGWEFNGNWFAWRAAGQEWAYRSCFRQAVTAMRRVPGQRFSFVWNPNIGDQAMPAERAYPGDRYVTYVSVDIYDYSWINYRGNRPSTAAKHREWNRRLNGSHGLAFWSRFARTHGKPLAFSEWGLAWRRDGHGGGDNIVFMNKMMEFMTNPANRVAYATYFNSPNERILRHRIVGAGASFPRALLRYQGWVRRSR